MRDLPVGETQTFGFGQQFSVEWRHWRNSRPENFPRVQRGVRGPTGWFGEKWMRLMTEFLISKS
jgi:hypothetical protein